MKKYDVGLTSQEAERLKAEGKSNRGIEVKAKSVGAILRQHTLTLFNLLNVILAALVISTGMLRNALFIFIIICNTLIGIVQELRARNKVKKLALMTEPWQKVIRDGEIREIRIEDIVLGDVAVLAQGDCVSADMKVIEGAVEVDQAYITGESDPVAKNAEDELISGSYIVAGQCLALVMSVGKDSYAARITAGAKKIKVPKSEIMSSVKSIIKTMSFIIPVVGVLLFLKQYFITGDGWNSSVVSTVGALIGMIPEGLVLLTSVVLAAGVIRLSQHQTLVQGQQCIETLARVDVLCLDKTGTITKGSLKVTEVTELQDGAAELLRKFAACSEDDNATMKAIRAHFGKLPEEDAEGFVPFSSARRWSAVMCGGEAIVMGAKPAVLGKGYAELEGVIREKSEAGLRSLVLAKCAAFEGTELPEKIVPAAIIVIEDEIRDDAPETLAFFAKEGVDIKIISGDDPLTVSKIAMRAGLANADKYIDLSELSDEETVAAATRYTVFGRVSPEQKAILIGALKDAGHTTAMMGDGVNDVLALRKADVSISVATGSDAARNVANLVLLDSNFSRLFNVVMEGRRAVNNIQRSASLFLVKTMFSLVLSVAFIFLPSSYPFMPIQLSLVSTVLVGVPSFFLALEPNRERIKGHFLPTVLKRSFPGSLAIIIFTLINSILGDIIGVPQEQINTLCMIVTGVVGVCILLNISVPFNAYRGVIFGVLCVAFVGAVFILGDLFYVVWPTQRAGWIMLAAETALAYPLVLAGRRIANAAIDRVFEKRLLKKGK